jgi:hypothetical protein
MRGGTGDEADLTILTRRVHVLLPSLPNSRLDRSPFYSGWWQKWRAIQNKTANLYIVDIAI